MADMNAQAKINLSCLTQAITGTQKLRSTVTNVFNLLCQGVKPDDDHDNKVEESDTGSLTTDAKKFLHRFQDYLQAVNQDFNEVEKYCNNMQSPTELNLPILGPTGYLSLDSTLDKSSLYRDTVLTYQWNQRVHEYSQIAVNVMQTHDMKKSLPTQPGSTIAKRRNRCIPQKFHTATPQQIDNYLHSVANQLKEGASLKISYTAGDTRILQFTISRAFVVIIVLRKLMLEKLLIKGLHEDLSDENSKLGVFMESQFQCMRKLTDHAMSTALEYNMMYQSTQPEAPIKYMLMWLQTHKGLFTDKCTICGKYFASGLPPLWRDLRNNTPRHDSCRRWYLPTTR